MPEFNSPPGEPSRLLRALERIAIGAGTLVLVITVFASWSSAGSRPVTDLGVGSEHIIAFGILGGCWGFAFPRRTFQLMLVLILTALVLEVGQFFVPDRHARLVDVATKIAGGVAGICIVHFISRLGIGNVRQVSRWWNVVSVLKRITSATSRSF